MDCWTSSGPIITAGETRFTPAGEDFMTGTSSNCPLQTPMSWMLSLIHILTKEWQFLGAGYVGGVPTPVILLAVVLIITAIIMNLSLIHISGPGGGGPGFRSSGHGLGKDTGTGAALCGFLCAEY